MHALHFGPPDAFTGCKLALVGNCSPFLATSVFFRLFYIKVWGIQLCSFSTSFLSFPKQRSYSSVMVPSMLRRGGSGLLRPSLLMSSRTVPVIAPTVRRGGAAAAARPLRRTLHTTTPTLTNFDAPFTTISQSGLSESQMDVREAIQAITDRFDDAYWLERDRTQTCE